MTLTGKQTGVLRGIVLAATLTLAVFFAVVWLFPGSDRAMDAGERLVFALQFDVVIVACLAIAIGALARHRFFTSDDIEGGGLSHGTSRAQILQANLQNTLEQSVLAISTHLVFASLAPRDWLNLIPTAVGLFLIGRVLFWRGYASGAPGRALGFALTFYPTVILIGIALLLLIAGFAA